MKAPKTGLRRALATLPLMAAVTLAGCAHPALQKVAPGEIPIVVGPSVRTNRTPMEGVFACYADHLAAAGPKHPIIIGVGDIKDYTGKYNINEGNAITQGGALMVYSALGKLGGIIGIAERFDPTVAERELGYIDRRQLGDGEIHDVPGPQGNQQVPWVPYFGGSIIKSDYYIVGGITELNYDVNSGGAEIGVNQIGGKARTYNESIGVDLRIVDTKTLMVVKTISLTKQLTGYEVGFNIFRFFGSDLFDINLGAKGQEPLQLGVRTALEEATIKLVAAVARVDPEPCMTVKLGSHIPAQSAEQLRQVPNPGPVGPPPPPAVERAINATSAGGRPAVESIQVPFEFGTANLNGAVLPALDRAAAMQKVGPVEIVVVVRDTENWDPVKRDQLIDQRISAIKAALGARGVAPATVQTTWRPAASDTSIHHDGPGQQEIAKLRVGA